jgi:tRNA(Arg) A34 adenosine deaminase TadA
MSTQREFILQAIELSRKALSNSKGGPFGAIVVKENQVVGIGYNQVTLNNDPTAHAEVVAIRDACKNLNTFQLTGCELYTSCEPCPMCLGAIYWARPDKVYYANTRYDAADIGFDDSFIYEELGKEMKDRKIPMIPLDKTEALAVFHEWNNKPDKIDY